ncbi:MAG: zinc metallopeptidase [Nitrospira sp. SB0677_bin_15]|nr:zinc metallopeptidase [Nitrospira sp. SB0667_bin_9]MYD30266.1 zinc metallopeptidase [Nitrospira sp. SB0661_bin_20]MYG40173.1 zinc metallopeptidase [Nitrospira sp. SB0677_bin_15]MYH03168.1 zinc metallopeptidase [Nitrospira sp. SB0675_bin_23]MYJ22553.1 zinc metallopeptidase [Nitrospira sp. SB0673_bin_12]
MIRGVLLLLLILIVLIGPQLWTKWVFNKYRGHREDYAGTGGELARHLLDRFEMSHVQVETTELGDHYDPQAKVVRLLPDHYNGKSLTAVTVAAHEVGHAIQDRIGYRPLHERTKLIRLAQGAEKAGSFVMLGIPIVAGLTRSPAGGLLVLLAGLAVMSMGALVHLVTLPVEWDASFRRALPILEQGHYIPSKDVEGARTILTAAALTYVAASLGGLLNVWRWIMLLRR